MTKLHPDFEDLERRVCRLRRRGITRRTVIGVLVTGVLVTGVIAPLAALRSMISSDEDRSQVGSTGETPTESPTPELTKFSDPEDALSIQAPSDWHFDTNPVPNLFYPKIDFALGTWAFPSAAFGPTELPCPNDALGELPADGIFIWVEEYDAADLGPEMAPLFESGLQNAVFEEEPVTGGCGGVPYYVLRFSDGQRAFQVAAAFGDLTSVDQRDAVLGIVHSITVEDQ